MSTAVTLPTFVCKSCGHSWYPRKPECPVRWDRPAK